jgi:hypothetical protein
MVASQKKMEERRKARVIPIFTNQQEGSFFAMIMGKP